MSKYARLVPRGDGTTQVIDTVEVDDQATLERLFSPELVAQWKAAGEWFVAIPEGVRDGATFGGSDYLDPLAYINPDNTYGDGTPIPPPQEH